MPRKLWATTHYDGRYGSWHVGVYNGTGYHAVEVNPNKPVEYRVTLRPLPDKLPGLQATYFGLYGKGNNTSVSSFGTPFFSYSPDWVINMGYLSYQHPWFLLSAQIIAAKGNQAGNWTTVPNNPGQSHRPEGRLPLDPVIFGIRHGEAAVGLFHSLLAKRP